MKVNIRNQCPGLLLDSGKHFSTGIDWNEKPANKVNPGGMTSANLIPLMSTFGGILGYDLEIRGIESTYIRLSVIWKSEGYKQLKVFTHLVEYEKWCSWSANELEEYYQRYASQLCVYTTPIKQKWLLDNGTVLMIELEVNFTQRDGVLNVTLSKLKNSVCTKKPEWISLKR
jgi:hypothetical protein